MQVLISDEVGQDVLGQDEICALIERVLSGEGLRDHYEVSVSFVDRDRIHELNLEYRGIDKPTDVLSFVIDDPFEGLDDEDEDETGLEEVPDQDADDEAIDADLDDLEEDDFDEEDFAIELDEDLYGWEGEAPLLGDVIICPEIVKAQAPGFGNSAADEMRLLLCHGCLHLMGYDHETPEEAEEMEARERYHLAAFTDVPPEQINIGPTVDHAAEGTAARR